MSFFLTISSLFCIASYLWSDYNIARKRNRKLLDKHDSTHNYILASINLINIHGKTFLKTLRTIKIHIYHTINNISFILR